ncbi:MAG: biotin transporter BioY [Candidatus Howiella sp.]|jgi:biotin transport system substrate-specific component
MKKLTLKEITATALMTALLCVAAPFTIPTGIIPISLASFVVYLAAAILGAKKGVLCVLLYILLGAAGLPVFSGFAGGLGKIAGPTGGYIVGYIFCALIVGLISDRWGTRLWVYPAAMAAGTAVLYAFGTVWFMAQSGSGLAASLALCVVPFLVGDIVKIIVASGAGFTLRRRVADRVLKK